MYIPVEHWRKLSYFLLQLYPTFIITHTGQKWYFVTKIVLVIEKKRGAHKIFPLSITYPFENKETYLVQKSIIQIPHADYIRPNSRDSTCLGIGIANFFGCKS